MENNNVLAPDELDLYYFDLAGSIKNKSEIELVALVEMLNEANGDCLVYKVETLVNKILIPRHTHSFKTNMKYLTKAKQINNECVPVVKSSPISYTGIEDIDPFAIDNILDNIKTLSDIYKGDTVLKGFFNITNTELGLINNIIKVIRNTMMLDHINVVACNLSQDTRDFQSEQFTEDKDKFDGELAMFLYNKIFQQILLCIESEFIMKNKNLSCELSNPIVLNKINSHLKKESWYKYLDKDTKKSLRQFASMSRFKRSDNISTSMKPFNGNVYKLYLEIINNSATDALMHECNTIYIIFPYRDRTHGYISKLFKIRYNDPDGFSLSDESFYKEFMDTVNNHALDAVDLTHYTIFAISDKDNSPKGLYEMFMNAFRDMTQEGDE